MSIVGGPGLGRVDEDRRERFGMRSWLGGLLLVSVALQLVGTFVRYETFGPFPARSDLPPTPASSFSLYDGLHWGRPAFFLTLAILCGLACLLTRPRERLYVVAFASGFCVLNLGTLAFLVLVRTYTSRTVTLGPGFYLNAASVGIAALFAVGAARAVRPFVRSSSSVNPLSWTIASGAALTVGLSILIRDVRVSYAPLMLFGPLSLRSAIAEAFAFVAVAVFPLIAIRMGGRAGSWLLFGLAAGEAIRALDAVLRRVGDFRGFPSAQLTIGWWAEILAVVLLVALARQLPSPEPEELQAEPASAGL